MIKDIVIGLFKPVTDIIIKRQERKAAREAAQAKLGMAKAENQQKLELNKDEYEIVATQGLSKTWKDEYVTLSVGSILNLIVIGGIASAFGYPQIIEGIGIALTALSTAGVDMGLILTATVFAGLGLSVWKAL